MELVISDPLTIDDRWSIFALMLYPEDIDKQKKWVEEEQYYDFCDRYSKGSVQDDLKNDMGVDYLVRAKEFQSELKLNSSADDRAEKGNITGDLLLHIYLMQKAGIKEPSKRKALFIASSRPYKLANGKIRTYSEKQMSVFWTKGKSVAHLWAAIRLNDHYRFMDDIFTTPENMGVFLSMARTLQDFANTFIPFRSKTPLIAHELQYKIPDGIAGGSGDCDYASNKSFYEKKLKKYKAPTH